MAGRVGPDVLFDVIIQKVVEDSRSAFSEEGLDTNVLAELQKLWKEKLIARGIGTQTHVAAWGMPSSSGHMASLHMMKHDQGHVSGVDRLPPQGGTTVDHACMLAAGVRVKHEGLPQTDGASHECDGNDGVQSTSYPGRSLDRTPRSGDLVTLTVSKSDGVEECYLCIDQVDGAGAGPSKKRKTKESFEDDDDDGGGFGGDGLGDDDEELGSEDDEDDEEPETSNLVLCQYDKVHRVKTKWKAQLRDGLMHLALADNTTRDVVFKTSQGEMNFSK